jgi:hypothetical protein
LRWYSSSAHSTTASNSIAKDKSSQSSDIPNSKEKPGSVTPQKAKQTMTERDADLLAKMRDAMGGSDLSNVEMEDGVPDRGMRRNVRENMFRII